MGLQGRGLNFNIGIFKALKNLLSNQFAKKAETSVKTSSVRVDSSLINMTPGKGCDHSEGGCAFL